MDLLVRLPKAVLVDEGNNIEYELDPVEHSVHRGSYYKTCFRLTCCKRALELVCPGWRLLRVRRSTIEIIFTATLTSTAFAVAICNRVCCLAKNMAISDDQYTVPLIYFWFELYLLSWQYVRFIFSGGPKVWGKSVQHTYAGSNDFKVPMLVQRDPHTGITSTSNEEVPGGQWQQLVRVSVGDTESTRVLLLERMASSPCHGPFAGHAHFIIPRWRASISVVESFSEDLWTLGWIHPFMFNELGSQSKQTKLACLDSAVHQPRGPMFASYPTALGCLKP